MLKKPASFVLTSFRSSTYPRGYASRPSLAAALLGGLFEHPAGPFLPITIRKGTVGFEHNWVFQQVALDTISTSADSIRNFG